MANMSFSSEPRERDMAKRILLRDVWMGLAPIALFFAYMLIRVRISNYAYVLRWMSKFFSIMLHR
jgi:hypothetical protein